MNSELENNQKAVDIKEKEYLDMAKKYEKYFERKDKDIILKQIKADLRHDFNVTDTEIISSSIYEYCCMLAAKVDNTEISRYIFIKNRFIFNMLSEEEKNFYNDSSWLSKISTITEKYTKKITPYS